MKFEYKKTRLKNGLRLIMIPVASSNVVSTFVLFGVGSRHESDDEAGISHVLEHMHFKGTTKHPRSIDVSEFIEAVGGETNAFTGKEYTGYYTKVAAKHVERSVDFLSDILLGSLFDAEELSKEKHVIYQELDMYNDMPMEIVGSKFEQAIFSGNALGREIIGTRKSLAAITRDSLLSFKNKHYVGENAVIAITGKLPDYDTTEAMIEKYFDFSTAGKAEHTPVTPAEQKRINILDKKTEQSHLIIGFRGAASDDKDKYALKILSLILGGSMSSRMFEEIREKRNLAYSIHTGTTTYKNAGIIETQAGVAHDKVLEAIEAIMTEYGKIKTDGVTALELQKAKDIIGGGMLISFEDMGEMANYFSKNELLNNIILSPEKLLEQYNCLTVEDIRRVAAKYLDDKYLTLALVGPWKSDESEISKLLKI